MKIRKRRAYLSAFIIFDALIILAAAALLLHSGSSSPVPAKIQSAVKFHVYYPRQKQLPSGFSFDPKSFKLVRSGVVLFSVRRPDGDKLIFSEEARPAANIIDKFNTAYIPLRTTLTVDLGKAEIGTYGNGPNIRTIASLPVHDGPWIIITAPADTDSGDLRTVFNSLADQ